MRYYDGRKHFPSRELGWTNAQKTWAIHLVCADLMTDFSILPTSPFVCLCVHIYAFRVTQSFVYVIIDLTPPSPILTLLVCRSFLIFFNRRNSEIYESP